MGRNDRQGHLQRLPVIGGLNGMILASIILSFVFHTMTTALLFVSERSDLKPQQEKLVLDLELDPLPTEKKRPQARAQEPQPQSPGSGQKSSGHGQAGRAGSGFQVVGGQKSEVTVPIPVDSPEMEAFLARIQAEIAPLWVRAQPPGMGQVELRMEINTRGEVSSLWITRLQGSPELGDFVAGLVRKAGPFPASRLTRNGPVVVDCSFDIVGGSRAQTR